MITKFHHWLFTLIILAVIIGCSKGHSPVAPEINSAPGDGTALTSDPQAQSSSENSRVLLLYNLLYIDPSDPMNIEVESVPLRDAEIHLNILIFLEQTACQDCFAVVGASLVEPGVIDVDLRITHPLTDDYFTIFDVRGIMMFDGGHTFNESGLICADPLAGNGYLANPDGYSSLYNIDTLGIPLVLQGYQKGKYSTHTEPTSTVNGYMRHWTDVPGNDRMAFLATTSDTKTYRLVLGTGPLVIGYAIDACWTIPLVDPVEDPLTDFGVEANCPEPWNVNAWADPVCIGQQTEIVIDIYDYEGMSTYENPIIECFELFNGTISATWEKDAADFNRWRATIPNAKMPGPGLYKCLVGVEAVENNPVLQPWLDQTAYQIVDIHNIPDPVYGWAQTFGGTGLDMCRDITMDDFGNILVTGYFQDTVDFDPGPGTTAYTAVGVKDVFAAKFTTEGNFIWARTWGSSDDDIGRSVAVDSFGDVYITGSFQGDCDFDPDPVETWWGNAEDFSDIFVTKLTSTGDFVWLEFWGETLEDSGRRIIVDDFNDVIVAGYDWIEGNFMQFLTKFDVDGTQEFLKMWDGAPNIDADGNGLALDEFNNIYICGGFEGDVDFNPDGGVETHYSVGVFDGYLSKFTPAGSFEWVRTWGGISHDAAESVAIDADGNIYMTGVFEDTCDFDPGPGTWNLTGDNWDSFLCKYDPEGEFQWATGWGGEDFSDYVHTYHDIGYDLDVDSFGDIYVTGAFMDNAYMDPLFDEMTPSTGRADFYLSKFSSEGVVKWVRTLGGDDSTVSPVFYIDRAYGLLIDEYDSVYVCGQYVDEVNPVDFDPGPDTDMHSTEGVTDAFIERFLVNGYWE